MWNNIAIIVLFCSISVESIRNRRNAKEQTSTFSLIPISETSSIKPTTLDEFATFWARPLPNLLKKSSELTDCDKYTVCVDTLPDDIKSEVANDKPNTTNNPVEVSNSHQQNSFSLLDLFGLGSHNHDIGVKTNDADTIVEDLELYNDDDYDNLVEDYDDANDYSVSDEIDEKPNRHGTNDITKENNKLTQTTTTSILYQQDNKELKHSDRKGNMYEVHVGNTTNKIGANQALYYVITTILTLLYKQLL